MFEKRPGLHAEHDTAPAAENWPCEHDEQDCWPFKPLKVPAGQVEHVAAPATLELVPGGHKVHDEAPDTALEPAAHETHCTVEVSGVIPG